MARIPYWRSNLQAWQKPTIAGKILPGTVTLFEGFGPELNVQEGPASGKDGGKIVIRGLKFARSGFYLEIDTAEDFNTFLDLAPTLMPVAQPQARDLVAVYHPWLALWGYTRGLVTKPEGKHMPRNGGPLVIAINLLLVIERDNATHTPANTQKGTAQTIDTIPLGGEANRFRDVRDRARPSSP